ncbi:hypothetical protein T265_03543 [Opisthorchis viverrini]|uniref:Uncharacterized protein n=1 Tax=Opisthorchis viverrini TaxID=6198 RepID=A0A074ZS40_OPIVI|nr:hypothetical protein T265_03543 [Opisthorchis viverrini]KER29956.1 hypothetical protein T265_03543 [Opisthorchis viverrini]
MASDMSPSSLAWVKLFINTRMFVTRQRFGRNPCWAGDIRLLEVSISAVGYFGISYDSSSQTRLHRPERLPEPMSLKNLGGGPRMVEENLLDTDLKEDFMKNKTKTSGGKTQPIRRWPRSANGRSRRGRNQMRKSNNAPTLALNEIVGNRILVVLSIQPKTFAQLTKHAMEACVY